MMNDQQSGHMPFQRKSMNTVENSADSIDIKQEPMIKEEPVDCVEMFMVSVPSWCCSGVAPICKVKNVNDDQNIEDFSSTHAKLEPKDEGEVDKEVQGKSKGEKQSDENDRSCAMMQSSKKGEATPRSSIGKSKKKTIDWKGRAKAVINAADRKKFAAKRTKKQHKCSSCEYVAPTPNKLKRHMTKHTGEKPFPCNICTKRFTQNSNLQQHLKTHTDVKYLFRCLVCLKKFAQNEEKSEHEANCNGRHFECHLCKKFSTPKLWYMKRHMRMHNGERPFRCSLCSETFTRKDHLKAHSKVHTNPRPVKFRCLVCARNFSKKMDKEQHERKCNRRRYECYLFQTYMINHNLSRHMRIHHTGDKPFPCGVCEKKFTQKI